MYMDMKKMMKQKIQKNLTRRIGIEIMIMKKTV